MTNIFQTNAPTYWAQQLPVIPIVPGTKQGINKWNNYIHQIPSANTQQEWCTSYAGYGIGLLPGKEVLPGKYLIAIDIDDEDYVQFVKNALGGVVSGKKGAKGLTIFVLSDHKTKKISIPSKGQRIIDILSQSICVLPPTMHPDTNAPYIWEETPLIECDLAALPILTAEELRLMKAIIENPNHKALMVGQSTHDPALPLMASLAGSFDSEELVCRYVAALFPLGYGGDTIPQLPEMFQSARAKGLGRALLNTEYEAGTIGPTPLGYTDNGYFVFLDQVTNVLVVESAQGLMSEPGLCKLAPMEFWIEQFPKRGAKGQISGIDAKIAGDALMVACRSAGPFITTRVRGCGIWREGSKVVPNLRGPLPKSEQYTYMRFASLPELNSENLVDANALLNWFRLFNWVHDDNAILLMGWIAMAPVCGAMRVRPHIFINGPKNSGKSTLIEGLIELLSPMVLGLDGTSSEAGLRQSIGPDSRPVVLDEFEADRNIGRMKGVLKLARSAFSAKGPVVRGTPEGKALQFQIWSTFCFGAINPIIGTSADASRIVELELQRHNNDMEIKKSIDAGLKYLHETRHAWTHQMIELLDVMEQAIEVFSNRMPPGDLRHNANMSCLLGAAFAALQKRVPAAEDADMWLTEHRDLLDHLAHAHEEDDSQDCLQHLICSDNNGLDKIGEMLSRARKHPDTVDTSLLNLGIITDAKGFLVANKHPELSRIFSGTFWADGMWKSALGRLSGAYTSDHLRKRFGPAGQSRCVFIPYECLDDYQISEKPVQY